MRIAENSERVRVLFSREIYRIRGCRRFSRSRSLLGCCCCFAIFRPRETARRAVLCISEMDLARTKYDFEGNPRGVEMDAEPSFVNSRAPPIHVCMFYMRLSIRKASRRGSSNVPARDARVQRDAAIKRSRRHSSSR